MIFHEMEQNSPEWYAIRQLKLTASKAQAIANQGKGLETLVKKLIIDYIAINKSEGYKSDTMERGHELEPFAVMKYEFERSVKVQKVGFIERSKYVGISPDGLVNDDGLIECKARNDEKHIDLIRFGFVDSATVYQMNMQILVSCREWCDFISYNDNFLTSIFIKRFYPDREKTFEISKGLQVGEKMIIDLLNDPFIKKEIKLKNDFIKRKEDENGDFFIPEKQIITEKKENLFQNTNILFG